MMDIKENSINLYELYSKMPVIFKIAIWTYIIAAGLNLFYDLGYKLGETLKNIL